jgi:hypothetical protein
VIKSVISVSGAGKGILINVFFRCSNNFRIGSWFFLSNITASKVKAIKQIVIFSQFFTEHDGNAFVIVARFAGNGTMEILEINGWAKFRAISCRSGGVSSDIVLSLNKEFIQVGCLVLFHIAASQIQILNIEITCRRF